MPIARFVQIQLGILAALLAIAWFPATNYLPPDSYTFVAVAMVLSALSGLVAYIIVSNGLDKTIGYFTSYIIGSMLAKLVIGLASVTIVALKFKPFAMVYVLTYFLCYFVFTSFEVYALMRKLRPHSKQGKRKSHGEEDPK